MNSDGGSSGFSSTPNFDNLLLESLVSRLQLRSNKKPSTAVKSLEELLLFNPVSFSESESDSEDSNSIDLKSSLAKEESKLEKEIIQIIGIGDIERLKPNSGQAISFGAHHICVGFQEDIKSGYRVWEWHGHIVLLDEENGYTPEYIYGNYFERVNAKVQIASPKNGSGDINGGNSMNLGLKDLVDGKESSSELIIHRNLNTKLNGFSSFT